MISASNRKPNPSLTRFRAPKVAGAVQSGDADRGILICGTGQGMAIVANKHKGVYACVVDSVFSAERSKIINNANVITMGRMGHSSLSGNPDRRRMAWCGLYGEDGIQKGFPHREISGSEGVRSEGLQVRFYGLPSTAREPLHRQAPQLRCRNSRVFVHRRRSFFCPYDALNGKTAYSFRGK